MAFVPFPAGCVGIRVQFNVGGIFGEITFGARFVTGSATYTDGLALANAIDAWVTASLVPAVTPNVTFTNIIVDDLTSSSGWQASVVNGMIGTHSGIPVQSQVSMVVTVNTAKRGRSYRGRTYFPGLPTVELFDSKSWSTGATTGWDTIVGTWDTALNTAGWTWVVLSRIQDKVPLTLGIATPVTGWRANAKLGTQRRRLA